MKYRIQSIVIVCCLVLMACTTSEKKSEKKWELPKGAFPIAYKGHLYIKGEADSIKGNYVFDTGAFNLYYDSTYHANNNFKYNETFNALLPGAGTKPQSVVVIKDSVSFTFASNLYKTSIVPILQLKPILGDIADGILGMEYFYDSVLEINYENEYMKCYSSIDSVNLQGWSKIKLSKKKNRLYVPLQVMVNDSITVSGEYLVDFGSGGSVSFTSKVANKFELQDQIKNKVAYYTKYGGVGGESSSYDFFARKLMIGDFAFDDVLMSFSLDKSGAMSSSKHLGLLGNDIYDRFHVIIDFINNDLYLKPNKKYTEAFVSSRLGFSFVDRGQTLQSWNVTGFYANSEAEKSGLMIDDKILTVNGVSVKDINYERQRYFFDDIDELNVKIKRKNEIMDFKFKLKPVITNTSEGL